MEKVDRDRCCRRDPQVGAWYLYTTEQRHSFLRSTSGSLPFLPADFVGQSTLRQFIVAACAASSSGGWGSLIDLFRERYSHGANCENHRSVLARWWAGDRTWVCSLWLWATSLFRLHHPYLLAWLCWGDHRSRRRSRPRNRDCSTPKRFELSIPTTRRQNAALAASNGKKWGPE